jgi:hypothetical protein
VALAVPQQVDLSVIEDWSGRELETKKFKEFERLLRSK